VVQIVVRPEYRRFASNNTMESYTELISSKYMNESLEPEESPVVPDRPKVRSTSSQIRGGITLFFAFVLGMAIYTATSSWACDKASKSTTVADWFLWIGGSDKTWDEYQRDQIARGNSRLKDKELGWMGQLLQDAYAGNNR
jgi:hypothetical protein